MAKLSEENQTLNSSLNDSLTTNAILQTELQSYRSQLSERQHMLLQYRYTKLFCFYSYVYFLLEKKCHRLVIIEKKNHYKQTFVNWCMLMKKEYFIRKYFVI
jgi:hypothetical protein